MTYSSSCVTVDRLRDPGVGNGGSGVLVPECTMGTDRTELRDIRLCLDAAVPGGDDRMPANASWPVGGDINIDEDAEAPLSRAQSFPVISPVPVACGSHIGGETCRIEEALSFV